MTITTFVWMLLSMAFTLLMPPVTFIIYLFSDAKSFDEYVERQENIAYKKRYGINKIKGVHDNWLDE
jgi:hypothetical protein